MKRFLVLLSVLIVSVFLNLQILNAEGAELRVGGGLQLNLALTVDSTYLGYYYTSGAGSWGLGVQAGLTAAVPVTGLYRFAGGWGIGGTVELGYIFLGGPRLYSSITNNYVADNYYINHAFMLTANFTSSSPVQGNGWSVLSEIGVVVMPTYYGYYLGSFSSYNYRTYLGLNLFVGDEMKLFDDNLTFAVGYRLQLLGWTDNYYAYLVSSSSFIMNMGLEFRLSWLKEFSKN